MRMTSLHSTRSLRTLAAALAACGLVLMVAPGACTKTLLSPTDERSPYDRYDNLRGQHAPQYVEDEYGRRQPNLRGRLAPKE